MKHAELRKVTEYAGLSRDSIAFNAELWIDGKLAAHVEDDGHGGAPHFRYVDRMHGKSEFEAVFDAWVAAMPPIPPDQWDIDNGFTDPTAMNPELWIGGELLRVELEKVTKRKCARNTLFRLVGDGADEYRTFQPARKYTPAFAAQLREKHGENLLEILNERFIKGSK